MAANGVSLSQLAVIEFLINRTIMLQTSLIDFVMSLENRP
jgi:hypothetical protein